MKEILYLVFVVGLAFVMASCLNASQFVVYEMEQKCHDANIESEELGYEVRMQQERALQSQRD